MKNFHLQIHIIYPFLFILTALFGCSYSPQQGFSSNVEQDSIVLKRLLSISQDKLLFSKYSVGMTDYEYNILTKYLVSNNELSIFKDTLLFTFPPEVLSPEDPLIEYNDVSSLMVEPIFDQNKLQFIRLSVYKKKSPCFTFYEQNGILSYTKNCINSTQILRNLYDSKYGKPAEIENPHGLKLGMEEFIKHYRYSAKNKRITIVENGEYFYTKIIDTDKLRAFQERRKNKKIMGENINEFYIDYFNLEDAIKMEQQIEVSRRQEKEKKEEEKRVLKNKALENI